MWYPVELCLKNWQSYVDQKFQYKNGVPVLIQGVNLDDESADSNGSGKSSLEEAEWYCINGSSIRKIRDLKLIRNGEQSAFISFSLRNNYLDKELIIEREIFTKGSSKLKIVYGGIEQEFASINDGNKLIFQLLGISSNDLQNYFIISKEKYKSFFSSSDADKKSLIGRFSNAEKILEVDKYIEEDIKKLEDEKKVFDDEIISLNAKIQVYNEEIENSSEESFNDKKSEEIEVIVDKMEECLNNIEKYEQDIKDHEKNIKDKEKSQKELEIKLKENEFLLETYNKNETLNKENKTLYQDQLDEYEEFQREINNNLAGIIKCPKCLHEFVLDEEFDIEEGRNLLPEIESKVADLNSKLEDLKTDIQNNNKLINSVETNIRLYKKSISDIKLEISQLNRKISNINTNIADENERIEKYNKDIEELEAKEKEDKKAEYQDKIKELKSVIAEDEADSGRLQQEIADLKLWILNFKKFYTHLTNKSLSIIEGYANIYLEKMKSPYQLKLEGVKMLADGKLKENITPRIFKNGYEEFEYNQLSGGQKGRIDFALLLTNQLLINLSTSTGGLDLLHTDEITESIDRKGHICLIDSLKALEKTILITTHINVDNSQNIITVKYENGESVILNN